MKIILATTPIRKEPTIVPPVGATSLLDTLSKAGYKARLYHIDALRPSFKEVVDFFYREQPDILGISATVSTAYRYTKELSHAVKQVSPKTKIILGGCLAASAEVLLRKCQVDACVIGEGEKVLLNLVKHWERFGDFSPLREEFHKIKGISFINSDKDFIFTGYEKQLLSEELLQPNYDLLAENCDISLYLYDPLDHELFGHDKRSRETHRKGQKGAYVMTAKGCTSRCTFCHRWIRGYRSYTLKSVMDTITYLKKKYNVGFFMIGAENFGVDKRFVEEFIKAIKPLDVLFRIGGVRMATVYSNPGMVHRLKDAGCVQLNFGMESGSDKILTIMEKRVTHKQNMEVAKLINREGMYTCHQLIIGMPGENDRTIKETIECVKVATEDIGDYPYNRLSITYFQSLPGTPGYEFMRMHGLVGKTLDDEEKYLLKVSDVNAASPRHYVNVSEEILSKVLLWPYRIRAEVTAHWYKKRGWKAKAAPKDAFPRTEEKIFGNRFIRFWRTIRTRKAYFFIVLLTGDLFWWAMIFPMRIRAYGLKKATLFTFGIRQEDDRNRFIIKDVKSLREMVVYPDLKELSISERNMIPLRMGQ